MIDYLLVSLSEVMGSGQALSAVQSAHCSRLLESVIFPSFLDVRIVMAYITAYQDARLEPIRSSSQGFASLDFSALEHQL